MLTYEQELWMNGYTSVAGIDEVGRGCLYGDVVAAAVILPQELVVPGVRDSKKLSEKRREQLFEDIMAAAVSIGIGRVDATTIDRINIKQAARLAMKQAVLQLSPLPDYLLIDAERIEANIPQQAIIRGEDASQSIAAASIIAKVTRDRLCHEWSLSHPEYGIDTHKGYATRTHREAIKRFGPSPMHRRSFLSNIMKPEFHSKTYDKTTLSQ